MSHFVIEQWKEYFIQVPGKVKYAVSNYGRLKSFTDTIENGKILKGAPTEGFLFLRYVRISNGVKKFYFHAIHKMVAELFLPKESEDQEYVLHLDYDKMNNQLYNLKWATYEEMRAHAHKSPAVKAAFKKFQEDNIKRDGRKLTSTQVMRIKLKMKRQGEKFSVRKTAKEFSVSEMQIYRIKRGENWGHIQV
ncbi:MAG TPA: NUMOD4 domain-containing protein [Flavobacterium sp.]|uniref:NUMOD4 domain-containing protein n=1 Tax=Flavobacterium sp. TaxID=239 RepID=UPI002B4B5A39|nr:NUMOD4 domain-containing protein [Flavobacterium sp.]HLO72887.1 NUMOD4 domain-containing protein [Flavobacterium sp.]